MIFQTQLWIKEHADEINVKTHIHTPAFEQMDFQRKYTVVSIPPFVDSNSIHSNITRNNIVREHTKRVFDNFYYTLRKYDSSNSTSI